MLMPRPLSRDLLWLFLNRVGLGGLTGLGLGSLAAVVHHHFFPSPPAGLGLTHAVLLSLTGSLGCLAGLALFFAVGLERLAKELGSHALTLPEGQARDSVSQFLERTTRRVVATPARLFRLIAWVIWLGLAVVLLCAFLLSGFVS